MSCYMASLSCESSSVSSIYHYPWMPCHIWRWQMASPLLQQVNVFSLVPVLSCIFKLLLSVNVLLHGFSLLWILLCIFNSPLSLNALSHLEQANGFSAVRILSWFFKSLPVLNGLSQLEQANGFSPVCHLCIFKLLLSVKNYENVTMRGTPIQYLIPKAWIVTLLCSLAFCHSGGAPEANRWQHCLST